MKLFFVLLILIGTQAQAITIKEFRALKKIEKLDYLQSYASLKDSLEYDFAQKKIIAHKFSPSKLAIIKNKLTLIVSKIIQAQSDVLPEVEDEPYGIVGPLKMFADVYFSSDNFFIGAKMTYVQEGCSHKNKNGEFYEKNAFYTNTSQAQKARCFEDDVSWAGEYWMDEIFEELFPFEGMFWTGH